MGGYAVPTRSAHSGGEPTIPRASSRQAGNDPDQAGAQAIVDGESLEYDGARELLGEEKQRRTWIGTVMGSPFSGRCWLLTFQVSAPQAPLPILEVTPLEQRGQPMTAVQLDGRPWPAKDAIVHHAVIAGPNRFGSVRIDSPNPRINHEVEEFISNVDPLYLGSLNIQARHDVDVVLGRIPLDPLEPNDKKS